METSECDAARTQPLIGLATMALRSLFLNGEALALPVWIERPGEQWGTRIHLIESDRLSTPPDRIADPNIRSGVEQDAYGAPVAYWIRNGHPGVPKRLGAWGGLRRHVLHLGHADDLPKL